MTQAEFTAAINALLAPGQPITANGQHKPSMAVVATELYDAQSRADLLAAIATVLSLSGGDQALIIRSGAAKLVPTTVFGGGVSGQWRGAADISGDLYPTNGSGTAGAVVAGDMWYVSVTGDLDLGTGAEPVPVKSILVALTDAPGQTAANWRVI